MKQIVMLSKMAQIMTNTESFIVHNAARYLPKNRSKMIDLGTMALSEFEDDFFSYDQLKYMVTNMVAKHISGDTQWHIDVSHTTSDEVVLGNDNNDEKLHIPAGLYLNMLPTPLIH